MHMSLFAYTLLVSLGACVFIVLTQHIHGDFTLDHVHGVQKFHETPVPRIGGAGLFLGLVAAWSLARESVHDTLEPILIAGLPALAMGLAEDVTRRVSVRARLVATMTSGVLICLVTGSALNHVDIPLIDEILILPPVAVAFTGIAIAGLANSINLIDGFNGLAGGTLAGCSAAFSVLAAAVGDTELAYAAALLATATLGFWLVNFPFGKIFLGDGGAYFGGFALAWIAVQLPMRNPEVSPWESLLVCAYPVIETLYSILRRAFTRRSPGEADARHLHSLIMLCYVKRRVPGWPLWAQHTLVSVPLWSLAALPALLSLALQSHPTSHLMLAFAGMFLTYHLVYQALAIQMLEPPRSPATLSPLAGDEIDSRLRP